MGGREIFDFTVLQGISIGGFTAGAALAYVGYIALWFQWIFRLAYYIPAASTGQIGFSLEGMFGSIYTVHKYIFLGVYWFIFMPIKVSIDLIQLAWSLIPFPVK